MLSVLQALRESQASRRAALRALPSGPRLGAQLPVAPLPTSRSTNQQWPQALLKLSSSQLCRCPTHSAGARRWLRGGALRRGSRRRGQAGSERKPATRSRPGTQHFAIQQWRKSGERTKSSRWSALQPGAASPSASAAKALGSTRAGRPC